ncbi:MAG: hypothetical protein P1V36_01625 [Planctomycetota bacterium]|nr:hypothetical protein [Planctomycetota bacterium]
MKNHNVLEGIECPKCGSQGPFRGGISASGTAYISDDGWEDMRTEESEFDGPFQCLDCSHCFDPYPDESEPEVKTFEIQDLDMFERCGVFDSEIQQVLDADNLVELLDGGGGYVASKNPQTGEVWLACWFKISGGEE